MFQFAAVEDPDLASARRRAVGSVEEADNDLAQAAQELAEAAAVAPLLG